MHCDANSTPALEMQTLCTNISFQYNCKENLAQLLQSCWEGYIGWGAAQDQAPHLLLNHVAGPVGHTPVGEWGPCPSLTQRSLSTWGTMANFKDWPKM